MPVNVRVPSYMGNSSGFYAGRKDYANNPNAMSALEFEATRTPTYTRKEKSYYVPKHRWHYEGSPQPVSSQRLYSDGKIYNGSDGGEKQVTPLETMAMQQAYMDMRNLMLLGDYSRHSRIRLMQQSIEAVRNGDVLVVNREAVYGMMPNHAHLDAGNEIALPNNDAVQTQRTALEERISELRNQIPMRIENAD